MPSSCVSWAPRSTRGTPTVYPLVCQCRKSSLTVTGDVWSDLPAQIRVFVGQGLTAAGSLWLAYFACTVAQRSRKDRPPRATIHCHRIGGVMKKLFLGSVALVALGLEAPAAFAVEMGVPAYTPPSPPAPGYTWSGCYAGGVAGTTWGRSNRTAVVNTAVPQGAGLPITNDFNLSGFTIKCASRRSHRDRRRSSVARTSRSTRHQCAEEKPWTYETRPHPKIAPDFPAFQGGRRHVCRFGAKRRQIAPGLRPAS